MFLDDYANWLWKKTTKPYVVHDMKHEKVYYSPSPKVPWVSGKVPAPLTWIFSQGTHFHSFFSHACFSNRLKQNNLIFSQQKKIISPKTVNSSTS